MLSDTQCRWRDLFVYALVAIAVAPFGARLVGQLLAIVPYAETPLFEAGYYVLLVLGLWGCVDWCWPTWRQFIHWRVYPPTLVAVPLAGVMGCGIASVAAQVLPSESAFECAIRSWDLCAASLAFSVAVIAYVSIEERRRSKEPKEERTAPALAKDLETLSIDELLAWAANEAPITETQQDLFGLEHRAERIAQSLLTTRPNAGGMFPQTVVIHGAYGSGKSSLVELIKPHLLKVQDRRMIVVTLNCWGFDSAAAVQEHILAECVEALHDEIDCTCLRSAPSDYVRAITSAGPGWFSGLLDSLSASTTPLAQIKRFAPLLRLANAQIVAVIEDTDRNGDGFDPRSIEALLYNFRKVERMSFVLTTGAQGPIEFPKIAERIEFIPQLPSRLVLTLLDRLRSHCRKGDHIDPAPLESRPESFGEQAATVAKMASFSFRHSVWPVAVGQLIAHPRQLKRLMNAFSNVWHMLRGEVDIDELLMVQVLRFSAPAAFTYLGVNLRDLRLLKQNHQQSDDDKKEANKLLDELRSEWRRITAGADFDIEAAEILLNELVPTTNRVFGPRYYVHGNRIQSIVQRKGPDYWSRLSSESLEPGEVRDQEVLRDILERPLPAQRITQRVGCSVAYSELLAFFSEHCSISDVERQAIFSAVHEDMRLRFGPAASTGVGNYDVVYGTLSEPLRRNAEAGMAWLQQEIDRCLPRNLRLACELYGDFARRTAHAGRIRVFIRDQAQKHFAEQSGEALAEGLDPLFPYTLYHLIYAYGDQPAEELIARSEDWLFLAPVILDAMRSAPDRMIPAALVTFWEDNARGDIPTSVTLRHANVTEFFGARATEFYQLAAHAKVGNDAWEPKLSKRIELSILAAQQFLKAGTSA